jgi:NADPH:quinone reductase-like Zn-dependent oxidoreductase
MAKGKQSTELQASCGAYCAHTNGSTEVALNISRVTLRMIVFETSYLGWPACVSAGSDCSQLAVGQDVFGLAHGCLGTVVTGPEALLVPMPPAVSYSEASSMPTVFTTVSATLLQAAALRPGERVLVHAAAGGVGLAALQVVASVGAAAVATAGSPSKRSLLRSLGVSAVVGSRDSVFVGPVSCLGGVDVVLNSLTSPGMVGGSLAVLKQGGRFVEIGKRDIWAPAAVAAERPDVCFSLVAVDFLPLKVLQQQMLRVSSLLAAGQITPLCTANYTLTSVVAAMRLLAQASHVGKVGTVHPTALPPILQSSSLILGLWPHHEDRMAARGRFA